MSDSKNDPFAVSRRVLIGAASATPLLTGSRPRLAVQRRDGTV